MKAGYKQTECGVIPEDWDEFALDVVSVKIQDGTHFSPKIGGTKYKYVTSKNIGNGSLNLGNVDMISEEEHKKIYKRCDVREGDILLTKDGINTGNAAINDLKEEFSLLSSVALIRLDSKHYDNRYLMYQILSDHGQSRISKMISGNAITRLTLDKIKRMVFPFPSSKHEQKLIAEKISCIDSLITSLEKLIEKKKLIKQGVMQELLTGKRRLPGFSGEWETKSFGDIAEIVGGGTPKTNNPRFWNGNINWFTPTEIGINKYSFISERRITREGLLSSSAKLLPIGTILLTSRAGIGDASILMSDGCTNQGFQSLVPKEGFYNEFLYYRVLTLKDVLIQNASGSTFLEISPNRLKQIEILYPPMNEQLAIAKFLSDMDSEIKALEDQLSKYRLLKQAMMQELLTGRIRLI